MKRYAVQMMAFLFLITLLCSGQDKNADIRYKALDPQFSLHGIDFPIFEAVVQALHSLKRLRQRQVLASPPQR